MPDPTRPPAEISAPQTQDAAPKESGLQSVIISPSRRAAIINGRTIELGGKLGNAKLVEVSESHVVLLGPQGRRELSLFPDVNIKKMIANNDAKPAQGSIEGRAPKSSPPATKADESAAPKEGR